MSAKWRPLWLALGVVMAVQASDNEIKAFDLFPGILFYTI